MKKSLKLCLLLTSFMMHAARASQSCGLTLDSPNISLVWNQNFTFQAVTLTVNKQNGGKCDFAVTLSKGGAADYNSRRMVMGSNQLSYQLYKDSALTQILKAAPEAASFSEVLTGSFTTGQPGQRQTLTYYVQIPQTQATTPTYKPSGTYSDAITLKLYENPQTVNDVPVATASATIATVIPKVLDLSITSSGGAFDPSQTSQALDFGVLAQGQIRSLSLMVRTNAGYSVSLSSQHNGALVHSSTSVQTRVPYTISVNSSTRDLSQSHTSPVNVASGSGQTASSGVSNPVAITIGSTDQTMSGTYSDNIIVTVATTE